MYAWAYLMCNIILGCIHNTDAKYYTEYCKQYCYYLNPNSWLHDKFKHHTKTKHVLNRLECQVKTAITITITLWQTHNI